MSNPYLTHMPAGLRVEPEPPRESVWQQHGDITVHVERIGDPDAPRRVVFLHGAGGHAGMLRPFASAVAARGVYVIVPDFPGYGRTQVPDRGAIRYPDWIRVGCELVRAERDAHAGTLDLFGASIGGLLAYDIATRTKAVDTVFATCFLDPRRLDARRRISRYPWFGDVGPTLMRVIAGPMASAEVPMRWIANMTAMSNDPAVNQAVLRDPYGGGNSMPLGFTRSFMEMAPAMEPEDAVDLPVVLTHPGADQWTPLEMSLPFYERLAGPKRLVVLENAGHLPVEEPGVTQLIDAIADPPVL
ncbi:alpha/beta hydrolase [Spiractinospora alimapuensis]|uniref:alpha/beta hydrolase n=1 Tax=Spiractinospora alimapuensis TaxID=2820884 RepID=UPI001F1840F5|nr:alpha/beta hydrolase [Spiractinospora alimapuensis]QVQ52787.1 alpha/beta hydrolase [Spiractinospora alimapuensis]